MRCYPSRAHNYSLISASFFMVVITIIEDLLKVSQWGLPALVEPNLSTLAFSFPSKMRFYPSRAHSYPPSLPVCFDDTMLLIMIIEDLLKVYFLVYKKIGI